jgi:hypothetical protein
MTDVSKAVLNVFGQTVEGIYNEAGGDEGRGGAAVERWLRTHKFQGELEDLSLIGGGKGGTGCNRMAMVLNDQIFKVVRTARAVPQMKFEIFLMKNCNDEVMLRHIPELIGHASNYWVTATRKCSRVVSPEKFTKDPEFKVFKKLGLGDDIYNNNAMWSDERNTWVIVDLGLPSSDRALAAAIQNIREGKHIFEGINLTHEDMCR